ncbi:hypothetical protein WDU94_015440 [Cyamophila willieti]
MVSLHFSSHLEPVGATKPKISTTDKLQALEGLAGRGITVLCPAQAFPSRLVLQNPKCPGIRSKVWRSPVEVTLPYFVSSKPFLSLSTEPVGLKSPTFSSDLKSSSFTRRVGQGFGLLCQAQGYPAPMYRAIRCRSSGSIATLDCQGNPLEKEILGGSIASERNQAIAYIKLNSSQGHIISRMTKTHEPVGLKAPTFSSTFDLTQFRKKAATGFALLCEAQAYPPPLFRVYCIGTLFRGRGTFTPNVIYTEPVGFKAPTFSSASDSARFKKRSASSFALLCEAQAYPVPHFRTNFIFLLGYPSERRENQRNCESRRPLGNKIQESRIRWFGHVEKRDESYIEPVGFKAPTFSSVSDIIRFKKAGGSSFALLCEAQAYPVPLFRTGWLQIAQLCV